MQQGSLAAEGRLSVKAANVCTLVLDEEVPQAMPFTDRSVGSTELEMPQDCHSALGPVLKEYESLFKTQLGHTDVAEHVIDTGGVASPVKVPSCPIPFHYRDRIHGQLKEIAKSGIIRPSNSPWCPPAVYVLKSNGEVRICVDYVQLNRSTKKDSYPVPRADGPQQQLAHKWVSLSSTSVVHIGSFL